MSFSVQRRRTTIEVYDNAGLVNRGLELLNAYAASPSDRERAETAADTATAAAAGMNRRTYDTRAAAQAANTGTAIFIEVGGLSYVYDAAGTALTTGDSRTWSPSGTATPDHWGAVGDFDGSAGTNSTTAINNALTWWAAAQGRHLHFPDGWYYYAGTISLDLGARKWNKITCDGQITFGGVPGDVSWTLTNHENSDFQLRLRNGGQLGDFSASTPVGGTTAIKIHSARWSRVEIEAMNYRGRVIHFTAGGTDQATRCQMMDINIKTGNRTTFVGDDYCGQPFFADSGNCDQTGAFGKISWRGEGCVYGPVFERLNDIDIGHIEAGKFTVTPMEFRGCVVVFANLLFFGATDVAGGANSENLRIIQSSGARLNGDFHIQSLRTLRSIDGIYATDFDPDLPGLRIGSYTGTAGETGIVLEDVPSAIIHSAAVDDMAGVIDIRGACGNIEVNVDKVGAVTGDVVKLTGTVDRLRVSGRIAGGAGSGFSLVNLGANNNKVDLVDLDLHSDTCDQLVSIGVSGSNSVRCIGGSMTGTSAKFNSTRRPEYAAGVRGYQTESCGQAVILNGTASITFSHGLDTTPQFVGVSGIGTEVSAPFLTSITSTQVTVSVPAAVTADRTIYWKAEAVLLRGDLDA